MRRRMLTSVATVVGQHHFSCTPLPRLLQRSVVLLLCAGGGAGSPGTPAERGRILPIQHWRGPRQRECVPGAPWHLSKWHATGQLCGGQLAARAVAAAAPAAPTATTATSHRYCVAAAARWGRPLGYPRGWHCAWGLRACARGVYLARIWPRRRPAAKPRSAGARAGERERPKVRPAGAAAAAAAAAAARRGGR